MNIKNKFQPLQQLPINSNSLWELENNLSDSNKELDLTLMDSNQILTTYWFKAISNWTWGFATFTKKDSHWIINSKWEIIIEWLSSYPMIQDMWGMLVAFFYLWRPFERWVGWISAALFFNNFNAGYCRYNSDWWISWNKWWLSQKWIDLTAEKFSAVDDFNKDIRWYARFEKIGWIIGYIDTKWSMYNTELRDWIRYVSIKWKLFKVKN